MERMRVEAVEAIKDDEDEAALAMVGYNFLDLLIFQIMESWVTCSFVKLLIFQSRWTWS